MRTLRIPLDPDPGQGDPVLDCYLLERMPGEQPRHFTSVIICPGGGYTHLSPREGEPVAMAFAAQGMQTFVLRYSLKPVMFPKPLLDAARAISMIRSHADEWDLDPHRVVIGGFSAGGHLSAALATFWNDRRIEEAGIDCCTTRPDGVFLGYAVLNEMDDPNLPDSFTKLICEDKTEDPEMLRFTHIPDYVTKENSPAFIWHTAEDPVVPVSNALAMADALAAHGVPFEMHIYPKGAHGLALANEHTCNGNPEMILPEVQGWVGLCCDWIRRTVG